MNNNRRKQILALAEKIEELLSQAETLRDEEQEYYDNMPEAFQGGEKGERAEAAISSLDDAISSLDDARNSLNESIE